MSTATEEFEAFAAESWGLLYRVAYLLTGDAHGAEDLAQVALMRTYLAWRRVRRDDAFRYARKVLANASVDRHRAASRRPLILMAEPPERASVDTGQGRIDDRAALAELLSRLTSRERVVVVLRYYQDLGEHEVAETLGISRGTVKSTASRALHKLRVTSPDEQAEQMRPSEPPSQLTREIT